MRPELFQWQAFFFVRNPVEATRAKSRKNEFLAFQNEFFGVLQMSFWILQMSFWVFQRSFESSEWTTLTKTSQIWRLRLKQKFDSLKLPPKDLFNTSLSFCYDLLKNLHLKIYLARVEIPEKWVFGKLEISFSKKNEFFAFGGKISFSYFEQKKACTSKRRSLFMAWHEFLLH